MSTLVRQLWVICIPLLLVACAEDHYVNGAAQLRDGSTTPTPAPTPPATTYVYATQDTGLAMTPTADGNIIPYTNVHANVNGRFQNGVFVSPKGGIYSVHMRVGFPAPSGGSWAANDWAQAYIQKSDGTNVAVNTVAPGAGATSALVVEVGVDVALLRGQAMRFGVIVTRNISTFQQSNNPMNNVSITSLYEVP